RVLLLLPCRLALMAILRVVTLDKLVEVGTDHAPLLQRELLVGAEIVDPHLLGPRFLRSWLPFEEDHVRLHSLCVEDASGQTQERVDLALLQQLAPNLLASPALEEDVVRHHYGRTAMDLQHRLHMLDEIELLVGCR